MASPEHCGARRPRTGGCRACRRARRVARPRLLSVEQRELDGRSFDSPGERARQLEHDGDPGRSVVGADEPRYVLRVVVSADDHDARLAARDPPHHVPVGMLDANAADARASQRASDEPRLRATLRRAGRARPERHLGAQVAKSVRRVEAIRRLGRGRCGPLAAGGYQSHRHAAARPERCAPAAPVLHESRSHPTLIVLSPDCCKLITRMVGDSRHLPGFAAAWPSSPWGRFRSSSK